jgi:hypothetical protein
LHKGWFDRAGAAIALIDPLEVAAAFKQARTSFHDVSVDAGAGTTTLPTEKVVCIAALQIDESNAQQGQQIVQMPKLRWSIDFAQAVNDPQASAFTITLDRGSLGDDTRIKGEAI